MTKKQFFIKRLFDIVFSAFGLLLFWWLIILSLIIASFDTKSFGLFIQKRVGRYGKKFPLLKIKTMKNNISGNTVTTSCDSRITGFGKILRKTKIDELPQLINVLVGQMSFVGPRPDVEGFADELKGEDRIILSVRPGITGPASIKYKNEEHLLGRQKDPKGYNKEVIWPDKVRINREYVKNYSFVKDLNYIIKTITDRSASID